MNKIIPHVFQLTKQLSFQTWLPKFQKVDYHTGGKWLVHGTKQRKGNRFQSLELPCKIFISWYDVHSQAVLIILFHQRCFFITRRIWTLLKKKADTWMTILPVSIFTSIFFLVFIATHSHFLYTVDEYIHKKCTKHHVHRHVDSLTMIRSTVTNNTIIH